MFSNTAKLAENMQKSLIHPPENPVVEKFFSKHPKCNFLKFLYSHKLHRLFGLMVFKFIYWFWFKTMNRIELRGRENIKFIKRNLKDKAFLIVENHSLNADVIMHYSIWGHLGFMTHVFTSASAFQVKYPVYTNLTHFIEMIPRFGKGASNVQRMVRRLKKGDIVNLFTAGTYPSGDHVNSGLVQEGFSGGARVAYKYWKQTGKKLIIVPVCSIGGNLAYPPRTWAPPKPKINHKIIVKFGKPFTMSFSKVLTYEEIQEKTKELQLQIAQIWGQKRLIPNYSKMMHRKRSGGTGKPRIYKRKK